VTWARAVGSMQRALRFGRFDMGMSFRRQMVVLTPMGNQQQRATPMMIEISGGSVDPSGMRGPESYTRIRSSRWGATERALTDRDPEEPAEPVGQLAAARPRSSWRPPDARALAL